MEPSWEEALDVDDSDIQSLSHLRPCKQQRLRDETNHPTTTTAAAAAANLSQSQTLASSQTVNSLPRIVTSVHQAESPLPLATIPGPAGIVQAAKLCKNRDSGRFIGDEESPMATQEYIRRVVEDPEEDDDFKRSPWISAIEFVYTDDLFSSVSRAPLGEIDKYQKNGKLDQVVAVIKFCAPNELGDFTVTLKDPTGTVSGTISHKLLTEGEFKKGICVGSVLILHKVSVFSPSRLAHYLNITKRNLVKVFYKDGGSSQKPTFQGCRIMNASSTSDSQFGTPMSRNACSLNQRAEGIAGGIKKSTNSNQSLHSDNQQEVNPNSKSGKKDTNKKISTNKASLNEVNVIESRENVTLKGTERIRVCVEPAAVHSWTEELANELEFDF